VEGIRVVAALPRRLGRVLHARSAATVGPKGRWTSRRTGGRERAGWASAATSRTPCHAHHRARPHTGRSWPNVARSARHQPSVLDARSGQPPSSQLEAAGCWPCSIAPAGWPAYSRATPNWCWIAWSARA